MIARKIVVALAISMLAGSLAVAPAGATSIVNGYQVETDQTHFNFNSGDFTMPHRVRFYRPGTDAVGARAQGNYKRGVATLLGDVVVHDSGTAPEATGDASYNGSGPATLTCDQLEIDSKQKQYTAIGHVHFTQGTRTASADRGVLNRQTGMLHLEGAVTLRDGGSSLSARIVDYNMNTKDADVHGAPAVISQPLQPDSAAPRTQPQPQTTPSPKPRRKP